MNLNQKKIQKILYMLLYIPCFLVGNKLDNDIWFILNSGRYVINNGIPYIEPFTIHQGMAFVMQQWLSSVIFWTAYNSLGEKGLIYIVILIYAILVFLIFKLSMLLSEDNFFVSYLVTVLASLGIFIFMVQRPYIFMFLIITTELYFLELYIKHNNGKYLIPLVLLSAVQINLQAAMWPVQFVVLLPYLIDSFKFKIKSIEGQGYGTRNLIFAVIGMFAAGFANPYGMKAVTYLSTSYGFKEISGTVSEMQCIDINSLSGKIMFAVIGLVFLSYYIYKRNNRLRYYLLALGTSYMALSSVRSFSIFIICGIIPLAYYFRDFKISEKPSKNDSKTLLIRKVLISLIFLVFTFVLVCPSQYKEKDSVQEDLVKCVDLLGKYPRNNLKIYTAYNEGGYLEFRGYKVYLDPRAEVFLKSNNKKYDIMKEFVDMQNGYIYYKNVLDKYDFNYLIVAQNDILYNYLDYDKDYVLIYSSSYHKVYEHKVN